MSRRNLLYSPKLIRMDITEAQAKKDTMKNYVNPYSNVARDGTFLRYEAITTAWLETNTLTGFF